MVQVPDYLLGSDTFYLRRSNLVALKMLSCHLASDFVRLVNSLDSQSEACDYDERFNQVDCHFARSLCSLSYSSFTASKRTCSFSVQFAFALDVQSCCGSVTILCQADNQLPLSHQLSPD